MGLFLALLLGFVCWVCLVVWCGVLVLLWEYFVGVGVLEGDLGLKGSNLQEKLL